MNANSTYQAPLNMTLDEWYSANNNQLENNRKRQVEDAYVNQQLMNKYLQSNLSSAGLSRSGVASEYMNQSNIDYRNQVANINKNAQDSQLALANQYYGYKKDEQDKADALAREEAAKQEQLAKEQAEELKKKQDTLLGIYQQKVDNSLNEYGYLDDHTINSLYTQFNKDELGDTNYTYLDKYINMHRGSEEDIKRKGQDDAYKSYYYKFNDEYNNKINNYESNLLDINNALKEGTINQDHYYELKSYLDNALEHYNSLYYNDVANKFADDTSKLLDSNGKLTQGEAVELYKKLEDQRALMGEENYMNIYAQLRDFTETKEEKEAREGQERANKLNMMKTTAEKYGAINGLSYITVDKANSKSFGDYRDTDGKQSNWVNEIINRAKSGKLRNGDLIDFNYGANASTIGSVYLYYDGKFFKTNKKAKEANIQSDGFAEDGFWEWLF